MTEVVEVPGIVAPCGCVLERPDPPPQRFIKICRCGFTWTFVKEHGGHSWKASR